MLSLVFLIGGRVFLIFPCVFLVFLVFLISWPARGPPKTRGLPTAPWEAAQKIKKTKKVLCWAWQQKKTIAFCQARCSFLAHVKGRPSGDCRSSEGVSPVEQVAGLWSGRSIENLWKHIAAP